MVSSSSSTTVLGSKTRYSSPSRCEAVTFTNASEPPVSRSRPIDTIEWSAVSLHMASLFTPLASVASALSRYSSSYATRRLCESKMGWRATKTEVAIGFDVLGSVDIMPGRRNAAGAAA